MRLSLRQLDYLVAIIDGGSMTRAAARLNVTPTSVSLQMKQLEELFGTRLLVRHSRGVSATDTGIAVYEHAQDILRRVADLERLLPDGDATAPYNLRLGAVPAATRMLGIEAMAGVARNMKGATVMLSEGWANELMEKLSAGTLDFVIAYDLEQTEEISVVEFFDDEFLFVCRPGCHPDGSLIDLSAVLSDDLVFFGKRSVSWRAVTEAARASGLAVARAQEVQSIDVWRGMLCRGLGNSVAPYSAVRDEVLRGDLAVHRISGAPIIRRIGMAANRETLEFGRRIGFVGFMSELSQAMKPAFQGLGPNSATQPTLHDTA